MSAKQLKVTPDARGDGQVVQALNFLGSHDNGLAEAGRGFIYRWWLAAPGHDESIRSLVERADRLYGESSEQSYVWQDRCRNGRAAPVDAPTSREVLRLARMLGVQSKRLHAHRLVDHPALLEPTQRRAYCPACIHADRVAGRPRAFRRVWARLLVLSCPEHGIPLHWAEPRLAAIADAPLAYATSLPSMDQTEVLGLIDTFARTLEGSLWQGHSWPKVWRGTPHAARALLIRCISNMTGEIASPPAAQLWLSPDHAPLINFPNWQLPPLYAAPWEAVRCLGRPAWRRAALWLAAWQVIPGLPARLRPETIPDAYLSESNRWWKHRSPSLEAGRLQRLYTALHNLCQFYPVNGAETPTPRQQVRNRRRRGLSGQALLWLSRLTVPDPEEG